MKRLSRSDAEKIVIAIDELDATGRGDVVKLHAITPPAWRFRVGALRVVFRPEAGTLWVESIGNRRDVYER